MKRTTLSVAMIAALAALSGGAVLLWGPAATYAQDAQPTESDGAAASDPGDAVAATEGADEGAAEGAAEGDSAADAGAEGDSAADAGAEDASAGSSESSDALGDPDSVLEEDDLEAEGEAQTDEPEGGAEEEEAAEEESSGPEPLPWRNTFFSWTNSVSFNSFWQGAQLSYNPVYLQNYSLSPRWYVAPMTFFWMNLSMQLEVTDTDGNALNRDPQLFDIPVEIRHMIPWEGFIFILQGRLVLPVSKASIAAERYIGTALGTTIVRPVSEANLTLAGLFRYQRWWAGRNMASSGTAQPQQCGSNVLTAAQAPGSAGDAPVVPDTACDQLAGPSAGADVILAGLSTTWVPLAGLSFNLSFFFFNIQGFELAPVDIYVDNSSDPIRIADGSPSHWRNFTFFSLSVAYDVAPWLNLGLGIQNSGFAASAWNQDGSVRNPVFTPDTQVFLTATIGVDGLYNELFGEHESDLTPEELQRRRQGLATNDNDDGQDGLGGTF